MFVTDENLFNYSWAILFFVLSKRLADKNLLFDLCSLGTKVLGRDPGTKSADIAIRHMIWAISIQELERARTKIFRWRSFRSTLWTPQWTIHLRKFSVRRSRFQNSSIVVLTNYTVLSIPNNFAQLQGTYDMCKIRIFG